LITVMTGLPDFRRTVSPTLNDMCVAPFLTKKLA
jgi:hypothetical protein